MANESIRIRTTPGENKNIRFKLDQEFDFLEILSLKLTQEEIYQPFCANYGVVVGRVIANRGFGVPNAKVSIFIPISDEDEKNLLIKNLYPFKTPYQKNNEGIRYNLLLSKPTCSLNVGVGTFPSKEDVLDNETMLEVFEKYYKYTTKTNDAGDYMIFGVPVGQHTVHMDVDISDIGAVSVRPYDLIAEGIPEKMFASKTQFKASTNLDVLPQIRVGNKGVDVIPFWGDPDTCEFGITRVDFDTNLQLNTTALFFGSIFTDSGKMALNLGCNPKNDQGEQDNFKTGAGIIKMIRVKDYDIADWVNTDTIKPLSLENFNLDGGELIDDDGVFAFPLPMNVGHVITDEFGNLIPSNDPTVGIATKGMYRFKMNFIEPSENPKLKTAHMLFPSLSRDFDGTEGSVNTGNFLDQGGTEDQRFTDDITAYRNIDRDFHLFEFKQLYTIAHYIKKYKKGLNRFSFLGIKNTDVSTETNPFPFTNAIWKFSFLYYITSFFVEIISFILKFFAILVSICFGFCFGINVKLPQIKLGDVTILEEKILFRIAFCLSICPFDWVGNIIGTINLPCENTPNGSIPLPLGNLAQGCCGPQNTTVKSSAGAIFLVGGTIGDPNPQCDCDFNDLFSFKPCFNINTAVVDSTIDTWKCCAKVSLAEEFNTIRKVFFDAWVLGTAYLFQFKYKKKIKKSTGEVKKEKFCGPGSDTTRGDNYKDNKCCPDDKNSNGCEKCLLRGPGIGDPPGFGVYLAQCSFLLSPPAVLACALAKYKSANNDPFKLYHFINHNLSKTGANDIDDVIYCNALMPTKIVSLGRLEMCEDILSQIENSINASRAISKYTQGHNFFTGTYSEEGWDLGYWVNYLKETSYEDPRDVIEYLASKKSCNLDPMFYGGIGCHEREMKDYEFFFMKEISKIYNDIITAPKDINGELIDVFEPSGGDVNPYANLPAIDISTSGGTSSDSGFEVDLEVANRFSPCGGGGLNPNNCNPGGNWTTSWPDPNDDSANSFNSFDRWTNPNNRNNKNTRSNIPYYYFGINPGKTAINKLRKDFFVKR
jgi:hypothetical protein